MAKATEVELYEKGISYLIKQNYYKAIRIFKKAAKLNPDNSEIYNNWGYCVYMSDSGNDNYQIASKLINKAIKLDPQNINAFCNRIKINELENKYDLVIGDYTQLIMINSTSNIEYYKERAKIKEIIGDYINAIYDINYVINNSEQSAELFYYRGLLKTKINQYKSAILDFELALKIKKNYWEVKEQKRIAEIEMRKNHDIIEIFNKFRGVLNDHFIVFWDCLSDKRKKQIKERFLKINYYDEPLFFLNQGSFYARSGILMTDKQLIIKNRGQINVIELKDIKSVSCESTLLSGYKFIVNNNLEIDIIVYDSVFTEDFNPVRFVELFNAVIQYYNFVDKKATNDIDNELNKLPLVNISENQSEILTIDKEGKIEYQLLKESGKGKISKIVIGIVLIILGVVLTVVTHANASAGGTYIIFYGLILVGIINFLKGLSK